MLDATYGTRLASTAASTLASQYITAKGKKDKKIWKELKKKDLIPLQTTQPHPPSHPPPNIPPAPACF